MKYTIKHAIISAVMLMVSVAGMTISCLAFDSNIGLFIFGPIGAISGFLFGQAADYLEYMRLNEKDIELNNKETGDWGC